jgi:hypothetical protein
MATSLFQGTSLPDGSWIVWEDEVMHKKLKHSQCNTSHSKKSSIEFVHVKKRNVSGKPLSCKRQAAVMSSRQHD